MCVCLSLSLPLSLPLSLSLSRSRSLSLTHTCLYIYIHTHTHVLESRKDVERSPLTDPCMCASLIARLSAQPKPCELQASGRRAFLLIVPVSVH